MDKDSNWPTIWGIKTKIPTVNMMAKNKYVNKADQIFGSFKNFETKSTTGSRIKLKSHATTSMAIMSEKFATNCKKICKRYIDIAIESKITKSFTGVNSFFKSFTLIYYIGKKRIK